MRITLMVLALLAAGAAAAPAGTPVAPETANPPEPQAPVARASTVRDVAEVKGAQEQQIFGIGLVVGLRGTGDKGRETQKRIAQTMIALGFNPSSIDLATKNAALVFITARVKPFAKQGSRLDVTVSSCGDASSLQGGELLPVPLQADNPGVVYARAQGRISVGGEAGGAPTCGTVPKGAILEQEIPCEALTKEEVSPTGKKISYLELVLRDEDYATARSVAEGINTTLRAAPDQPFGRALDPSLIRVEIPEAYRNQTVAFVDEIMKVPVVVEPPATVAINEQAGVVVITGAARVSPAEVSVGNIRIKIGGSGALLSDLQAAPRNGFVTNAEFIAVVKELARAGALQARLVSN